MIWFSHNRISLTSQRRTVPARAAADRAAHVPALQAALTPLRSTLKAQPFIAGAAPAYADHIVFGALQWGRLVSYTPLLAEDDPIVHWMDAVLGTYGL